ncbi:MAG TPA: DUF2911 domain-containing protein [Gemmatimonadaceae bacterium]|nr:DUF2911 domain-containing protein [Gemmatimonadaceae bacterium]
MRHPPGPTPRRAALLVILLPALAACASRGGSGGGAAYGAMPADAASPTGAYVTRLGTDTLAIERVAWSDTALTGEIVVRSPASFVRTYAVRLAPDGRATHYEADLRPLNGTTPAPSHVVIDIGADSARWEITSGTNPARRGAMPLAAGTPAIPFANFSSGLFSLMTQLARRSGSDSMTVALAGAGSQQPFMATLRRAGRDSFAVAVGQPAPYRVRVDALGNIVGLQGFETTQKIQVERVPDVDMRAIERSFASRDLGPLSARDSLTATFGAAHVFVDYGRPFMRGRKVFGGIVPHDSVWRTGANFATVLRTDRDIVMGGQTIPAGKYTLWTVPSRTGAWKLIVNKKTLDERGNPLWGTMYDASQDLARVDIQTETLPQPVEEFTITIEPRGPDAGALRMAWERTGMTVPFTVKP